MLFKKLANKIFIIENFHVTLTKSLENLQLSYLSHFRDILFPAELHLKNVYYLYSACSNPTNVVLVIVLSMLIGKGA